MEKKNSYLIYLLVLFVQKSYMVGDQDPTLFAHRTCLG